MVESSTLSTIASDNVHQDILKKYAEVTRPARFKDPLHPVRHHIITKGPPCSDRARRLSPERLHYAKKEIESWLAEGIISPSCSPYASAILMRRKPDG